MTVAAQPADDLSDAVLEAAMAWRVRMAAPEWSGGDDAALEAWLQADARHDRAFERTGRMWDFFDHHHTAPELMIARRDVLDRAQRQARRRWAGPGRFVPLPGRRMAAAIGALAIVLGGGLFVLATRGEVYQTGPGERRVVTLADGSRLSLDTTTRVSVRYSKAARRLVLIRGQARFDVAHDTSRPFSVLAHDRTVVATGTAFNIDLLDPQVRVTLIEGRVMILSGGGRALAAAKPARPIELRSGQELVAGPSEAPRVVSHIDLRETTAWQQGKLIFDDEPLAEVVGRVNRYSDRKISIGDPAVGALKVSGVFDTGDIKAFVGSVTTYLPVAAVEGPDGVSLRSSAASG